MAIITKADIINGKHNIQTVRIKKLGGELKLRPLTDGEFHKINALMTSGGVQKMEGKITPEEARKKKRDMRRKKKDQPDKNEMSYEIDPMDAAEKKYSADVMAIYYSLQHEECREDWTEDEIKQFWPAGSVEETALKVYEISGVEDPNRQRRDEVEEDDEDLEGEMEDFRPDEQGMDDSNIPVT